MFDLTDIRYGWAILHIGKEEFPVSYLTDIEYEFERIFSLRNEEEKIIGELDGEGSYLKLECRLCDFCKNISILYVEQTNDIKIKHYTFGYEEFKNEVEQWFKDNRKIYDENFIMEERGE